MHKTAKGILISHYFQLFIIVGFTLWFTFDIYTLKQFLNHPDIYTYYYPYRQWFSQNIFNGVFPLWNPYWGIGNSSEVWSSIPIDVYTILEYFFGYEYHYYQILQLLSFLFIGYYALNKLGFKPTVSMMGIILYFMTPWVTYFYFYFLIINSFIGNILLFTFVYLWFKTEEKKYLLYIFFATAISMLGTKAEFWFFNSSLFSFYVIISSILFYRNHFLNSLKSFFLPLISMGLGIVANLWQLNILIRIMAIGDRTVSHSIYNIFSSEMYHNLLMSITESELLKMLLIGFIIYYGFLMKSRLSWGVFFIGIIFGILLEIWSLPVIISFIKSPVFIGAILGLLVSIFILKETNIKRHISTTALFLLFVYYWCRPEMGDLGEMPIIQSAPLIFQILLSMFVWLGCYEFWKSKLAKLAYFSILFVLIMRTQGQIILSYLTGLLWIPTRDNYTIDFAVSIIAVIGISRLRSVRIRQYTNILFPVATITTMLIILSSSTNFYYSHIVMEKTPENYPYYSGVPEVREIISNLKDSPTTRIFLLNDYYSKEATFGFGSCLLEGVGQVSGYSSILPANYKNWTIYKQFGIVPEQKWGGYTGGYTKKTIAKLPKRNTLGYDDGTIFFHSVRALPPIKRNELRFLGVKYVVKMFLADYSRPWFQSDEINMTIDGLALENINIKNGLMIGDFTNPLPRAFITYDVNDKNIVEFMNERDVLLSEEGNFFHTESNRFHYNSTTISHYDINYISLETDTEKESYLVLSDLYHPFWQANIDGAKVEIIPALHLYRAVKLPPGKHIIEFYANIPHFNVSVIISLAVILLYFVLAILYFFYIGIIRNLNKRTI